MSETFRPAEPEEVEEVARLEAHSFPAPGRTAAWWVDHLCNGPHGGLEALWVAEEGGRLVGACQLLWLNQWVGGKQLRVMGLAAVATSPTHRKRGMAGRMLGAGFEHARERGDVASALYPFRASFYEDLGYGLAGEAHQYQIPPNYLPDDKEERRKVQLVDTDADREAVEAVYLKAARRLQTGQLGRTRRYWEKAWQEPDHATVVYYNDDGEPEGYCIVRYRADLPLNSRYLEVEERAWLTVQAQRGIYAWLSTLGDQWRELVYRAHPEEGFGDRIMEPRLPLLQAPGWRLWFPSATLLRGPMFRLLDVPAALEQRTLASEAELTLRLEVADDQVTENRGPWKVRMEGGAMQVEPYTGGHCDASLSIPMETLSRVYIGAIAPWQAIAGGLATIEGSKVVKMLDRAFEVPKPWTFDRF